MRTAFVKLWSEFLPILVSDEIRIGREIIVAWHHLVQGRPQDALQTLMRVGDRAPQSAAAFHLAAALMEGQGLAKEAKVLRDLGRKGSASPGLAALTGVTVALLGRALDAADCCVWAIHDPADWSLVRDMANALPDQHRRLFRDALLTLLIGRPDHEAHIQVVARLFAATPDACLTAFGEITSIRQWCAEQGLPYRLIRPSKTFLVRPARNWRGAVLDPAGPAFQNDLYLAEIRNVVLASGTDFILGNANQPLHDIALHNYDRYNLIGDTHVFHDGSRAVVVFEGQEVCLDRAIMMSGFRTSQFGHWIGEYLPKWQLFETMAEYADWPILVDAGMPASHMEALRLFVGSDRRILPVSRNERVRVEHLAVAPSSFWTPPTLSPSHRADHSLCAISSEPMRYLRRKACPAIAPPTRHRRLFLTRGPHLKRRCANQDDVARVLARFGFDAVDSEHLTFSEQIALMASAEWIVAANGSQLSTGFVCRTDCRILVLVQSYIGNWAAWSNCMNDIGLDVRFLVGAAASSGLEHDDYVIDPAELAEALSVMGCTP